MLNSKQLNSLCTFYNLYVHVGYNMSIVHFIVPGIPNKCENWGWELPQFANPVLLLYDQQLQDVVYC